MKTRKCFDVCWMFQSKLRGLIGALHVYFTDRGEDDVFNAIFGRDNPYVKVLGSTVHISLPNVL